MLEIIICKLIRHSMCHSVAAEQTCSIAISCTVQCKESDRIRKEYRVCPMQAHPEHSTSTVFEPAAAAGMRVCAGQHMAMPACM